jgi:hypothetical protein
LLRVSIAVAIATMALSFSAVAQQSSDHTELEAQRLALDRIDETFKREGLSESWMERRSWRGLV